VQLIVLKALFLRDYLWNISKTIKVITSFLEYMKKKAYNSFMRRHFILINVMMFVFVILFFKNAITRAVSIEKKVKVYKLLQEGKLALVYLNKIRNNTSAYSEEIGINLEGIKKRKSLIWNEKLRKSAQNKAEDMARRNYVGHFTPEGLSPCIFVLRAGYYLPLNWPNIEKYNYIESISAGSSKSGKKHIINLLYDKGAPNFSSKAKHRKHLLGMNKIWSKHIHIGIGFAYNTNSKYKGYFVIHTGVPGFPSVKISGILHVVKNDSIETNGKIWVGAQEINGRNYWTEIVLKRFKKYYNYSFRVPEKTRVVVRYYKHYSNGKSRTGYYSKTGTVAKKRFATIVNVGITNIYGINLEY
jgi:hypothetical protein